LGRDFEQARRRTLEALDEFVIYGVDTTLPFHKSALNTERFIQGDIDTGFVESSGTVGHRVIEDPTDEEFAVAAFLFARSRSPKILVGQGKTPRPSWTKQNKERFVDAL
ncbi:MAG: hypothetical protein OK457_06390, partial [Thaumarchaeota archaeon]|nr:hypothetical protein [Nitrososphaerota archaeon]